MHSTSTASLVWAAYTDSRSWLFLHVQLLVQSAFGQAEARKCMHTMVACHGQSMWPVQDPAYRALSRQRNTQANERVRTAQQVEPKDIMNAQRLARLREPASMKSAHKRVVCLSFVCYCNTHCAV